MSEPRRILCVCDRGVSRAAMLAQRLKNKGYDTLPVGVETASRETLALLADWADLIILTDESQRRCFPAAKIVVWPLADIYRRPLHRAFEQRVTTLLRSPGPAPVAAQGDSPVSSSLASSDG